MNPSTRLYAAAMGLLGMCAAGVHGLACVLAGNAPTGGLLLASVGVFTLLPSYLMTGIAALTLAGALGVWSVFFLHRPGGPPVFLLLAAALFLCGGGVAQVPFLLITWAVSTRIRKPLAWWSKALPERARARLSALWPAAITLGFLFLASGVGIWLIWLPPGVARGVVPLDYACWACLALGLLLQPLAVSAGFARDIGLRRAAHLD